MSLCASRSLGLAARVLSVSVAAAAVTFAAFEPAALAQATAQPSGTAAPKKEPASKPAAATTGGNAGTGTTPGAAPASTLANDAKPATADGDRAKKDAHRAVYLSADIGFQRVDVGAFSDNTGFDKTGANGFLGGFGIGFRYEQFRIGGRFRSTSTTEYSLWSLMGEVGYGLPFRPIAPSIFLHAGYVFDVGVERAVVASSLPRGNVLTPDVDLNGVVVGGELVASYWFSQFLRLGPFIGFDVTVLSRSQANLPQSLFPLEDVTRAKPLFSESGGGLGYVMSIGLRGTGDISF